MDREEIIYELEKAILEYKEEKLELSGMRYAWNKYEDPGNDPGIQYEQEEIVDKKFKNIIEILKSIKQ